MSKNTLSYAIVACAIEVHKALGPGCREKIYHECLATEFRHRNIQFEHNVPITLVYRDVVRERALFADFVVTDGETTILVEIKAAASLQGNAIPQALTYMRLKKVERGMVINFGFPTVTEGVRHLSISKELSKAEK